MRYRFTWTRHCYTCCICHRRSRVAESRLVDLCADLEAVFGTADVAAALESITLCLSCVVGYELVGEHIRARKGETHADGMGA